MASIVYWIQYAAGVSESHVLEHQLHPRWPRVEWNEIFEQIKMDSAILSDKTRLSPSKFKPFHSDCWSLLSEFISTSDMDLKELAWVCQRRPLWLWNRYNRVVSSNTGARKSKSFFSR